MEIKQLSVNLSYGRKIFRGKKVSFSLSLSLSLSNPWLMNGIQFCKYLSLKEEFLGFDGININFLHSHIDTNHPVAHGIRTK